MYLSSKIPARLLFALLLLTTACALGPREVAAPRTYFLNPEISVKNPLRAAGKNTGTVLLITQPRAQAGFDTARMAYLLRPYEVNYYGYNQWADTPARLLHRVIVESFDKSGLWHAVVQFPSGIPAQHHLDCDNLVLEQQFFSRPSRVRLALRAQIVETKTRTILASRYFEFFEDTGSDDAYGGVEAANRAAATMINQLLEWANATMEAVK